jgi:hypothetical protein
MYDVLNVICLLQPCTWSRFYQDIQLILNGFQMKNKQNFNGYKLYVFFVLHVKIGF